MRLSAGGRAALSGILLRRQHLSAAVAALSALPRGAGATAVGKATARFRGSGSDADVLLGREPAEWPRGHRAPPKACWFCDRAWEESRCRIVSGPRASICEDCVQAAAGALSALAAGAREDDAAVGRGRCSFCGKEGGIEAGRARLLSGQRTPICHECVPLCVRVFDDRDESDPRAESLRLWLGHLSSPQPFLQGLAAVALSDWGLANDPAARQALMAALVDIDWRVRALAEETLSKAGALPDDYRPSFVGRLRSLDFMNVYYGDVLFAEQPTASEGGSPGVDSA